MNNLKTATKTQLAKKLGVARSSLYYRPKRPARDAALKQQVTNVLQAHPAYGHRRVALELKRNHKPIRRVMRLFGLHPRIRRKQPIKLLDQGKPATLVPNLGYRLCPLQPTILWAGDFTYFPVADRFIYLATVIDVYTREIVGWHISDHHTTELIQRAFSDAVNRRQLTPRIFHSDQGSEYTSAAFLAMLQYHDVQPSHAQKSSPWQNGYQESFYSQFKLEVAAQQLTDRGHLIAALHYQVHYYNTRRIHTALKMAPAQFLQNYIQKTTTI